MPGLGPIKLQSGHEGWGTAIGVGGGATQVHLRCLQKTERQGSRTVQEPGIQHSSARYRDCLALMKP